MQQRVLRLSAAFTAFSDVIEPVGIMWACVAYFADLRRKIVDAVKRGLTKTEVARTFGVSRSSVKRYVKRDEEFGSLVPSRAPGSSPKIDDRAKTLL